MPAVLLKIAGRCRVRGLVEGICRSARPVRFSKSRCNRVLIQTVDHSRPESCYPQLLS